jgi:hypothetical protein
MRASLRLIRRILEAETAYGLAQLQRLEGIGGNFFGLAWRQLDAGALAQLARRRPGPAFNRLLGLRADHMPEIEPLLAWYQAAGVKAQLETISAYTDVGLTRELVRRGYFQSGFRVMLAGRPRLPPASAPGLAVERITNAGRLDEAFAPYREAVGLGTGAELHAQWRAALAAGSGLYLSSTPGAAAAAVLFIKDGIGYCAPAALAPTGPELDVAPLLGAIADAAAAGLACVCAEADLLSARHRQLLGLGLTATFVRALWTQL